MNLEMKYSLVKCSGIRACRIQGSPTYSSTKPK